MQHFKQHAPMHGVPIFTANGATATEAVKKSYSGVPHSEHPSDSVAKIIYKQHFKQHSPMHGVPIFTPNSAAATTGCQKVLLRGGIILNTPHTVLRKSFKSNILVYKKLNFQNLKKATKTEMK